tara:strand:- start:146 stop:586 length:441 start_codon:yes stop_codon:yes gene_type:complete
MTRLNPTALAVVSLLGLFVMAEAAEASNRIRSTVDRRQRPDKGFWESKPSQRRSYSSSRSMFRSTPQRYTAPRTYIAPQRTIVPQTYVTPQRDYVPQSNVVIPAAPVSPTRVVTSQPVTIGSPVVTCPAPTVTHPMVSQSAPVFNR